ARELNMVPIQWSVDSLDWQNLTANQIIERVTKRIHPGAIVLFHNDGTNTPQALESIIQYLHNQGYSIVPISGLIYKDNYYIDVNGIQKIKK
ncbi:MAG: polysaccharide deacetylase family protein, partial [Bacillota bacterium]